MSVGREVIDEAIDEKGYRVLYRLGYIFRKQIFVFFETFFSYFHFKNTRLLVDDTGKV